MTAELAGAPVAAAGDAARNAADPARAASYAARSFAVALAIVVVFAAIGAQLVRLALKGQVEPRASMTRTLTQSFWRPDIVDRQGRLLATDIEAPTLYADPALMIDVDEAVERLSQVFPEIDGAELRRVLSDRDRRFVRLRRGVSPATAQRIHDFGLPGLAFRNEPKRVYPNGALAGHVIGHVNTDNQGTSGIERYIDETVGIEAVHAGSAGTLAPVRVTIDLAVQHALEDELRAAVRRYAAAGAGGVILDVDTGEVLASASLPEVDPADRMQSLDPARLSKVADGVYELGSIFKTITIAMALEAGTADLGKTYDVRAPLRVGPYTIRDLHPLGRPLTVREIFIHSSNVGAGMIALELGSARQRELLARLGLIEPIRSEAGPVAAPKLPAYWGQAETITIAYGHGLAVAPIQFAAAAAALVNGGWRVTPTFRLTGAAPADGPVRVVRAETSAAMRELMRRNVVSPQGTGRRADVPGYEVGGKTGTAERPGRGGYREEAVIASFLAAFPMRDPKYLVLVLLHEPKATEATGGRITAGVNAAPVAGRVIARAAPLLGMLPR
ncbi:MAG: penicillin-binding protein 2 [Hyphomicrobiaceae bacterium]|nr:penicillin-binding protein 2 [Hyphomicrobiaceae bacterium]